MKNVPADRPRLTCRLARGTLAIFGATATGEPRGLGASHVAACEECQAYFGTCDAFDLALKHDALAIAQVPSANLEQNILRAARQAPQPARRSSARTMSFTLIGAMACAAIAVAFFPKPVTPPPKGPDVVINPQPPGDPVTSDLAMEALLTTDPLQSEVDAVVADAQSAVQFLARNFLPSSSSIRNG